MTTADAVVGWWDRVGGNAATFICPITQEIMRDPVSPLCGHTFERNAIEQWFRGNGRCPLRCTLCSKFLKPNFALRDTIEEFVRTRRREIERKEKQVVNVELTPTDIGDLASFFAQLNLENKGLEQLCDAEGIEGVSFLRDYNVEELVEAGFKRGHAKKMVKVLSSGQDEIVRTKPSVSVGQPPQTPVPSEEKKQRSAEFDPHVQSHPAADRKPGDPATPQALWELGNKHRKKKEFVEAVRLYRLAAEQGHARAQCSLGLRYERGEGVRKDLGEATRLYRLAAKQGEACAQFNLGVRYDHGQGVERDLAEAIRLYRLAAEQGHAEAQYNLGGCYEDGEGVAKDLVESARLYRQAAEQGLAYAQYNLGWCYEHGEGVGKDLAEATRLYRLAAEQGLARASSALSRLS